MSVPLSSAREIARSSALAYRACLRSMPTQIKFLHVTDGMCLVCTFSVLCPYWSSWERKPIGEDSRGWVLFWGEGSWPGRRTVSADIVAETTLRSTTWSQRQPMNLLGIRGDWQSLVQSRKPGSSPKPFLQARISLQRSQ